ncbi:terminase [Clostridia bacterium]|nr:terminase [Clostridia bacterium]
MNYIAQYNKKIQSGKIIAGEYVKQLYSILSENIANKKYIFKAKYAENAIKFIEEYCHHSKGRNDLIKLELWQKALISAIFGLIDENNLRIFKEIFIVIGKKNGKSLLAAAIIAYSAFIDGEYGSEIYCIATKKEQAEMVFNCFTEIVNSDVELSELCKIKKDECYIEKSNTIIKMLAASPKTSDGLNSNLIICDEVAAWIGEQGLRQYNSLKSGIASRNEPLIISITTAGYESGGIYDELFMRGTQFLNGDSREQTFLPFLYQIDDEEEWSNIEELKKANPNLGVSVKRKYFGEEIETAFHSDANRVEFIVKHCNIKQNPVISWLPFSVVDGAGCDKKIEEFQYCQAIGGMDLSKSSDLTAASVIIKKYGIFYIFTKFFIPSEKFRKEKRKYKITELFEKQGIVKQSGQNFVDYRDVLDWFLELRDEYDIVIQFIGYDRYSAQETVSNLKNCGFKTEDVYQGFNLHTTIDAFNGLIRDGKIKFCNNELLKFHFNNCTLYNDPKGHGKWQLDKIPNEKNDGALSVIDAFAVYYNPKYYEKLKGILENEC